MMLKTLIIKTKLVTTWKLWYDKTGGKMHEIRKILLEMDTIGFVAPSFGCNIEPYRSAFENAQKVWTKEGYSLSLGLMFMKDAA